MKSTPHDLQRIYAGRFSPEELVAKDRVWQTLVRCFFQRWVGRGDTVLDLGCGFGEFLHYVECGRKIGVDLNPNSRELVPSDVDFHQVDVCELDFIESDSVDFVFTSNLMEHLPDKRTVEQMLSEARRVLRPGGQFVALGPNLRFLPGEYWDFWDHTVPITDRSLVEVLRLQGFDLAECIPRFLPYTTRSRLPQHPLLVRMYLCCRPLWRLLGRQFLVRASKPAGTA